MPDPETVSRAHRAAVTLEGAWERWRLRHGLTAEPKPPVSSYVGYSIADPSGRPRVVFGVDAAEAEALAALLDGDADPAAEVATADGLTQRARPVRMGGQARPARTAGQARPARIAGPARGEASEQARPGPDGQVPGQSPAAERGPVPASAPAPAPAPAAPVSAPAAALPSHPVPAADAALPSLPVPAADAALPSLPVPAADAALPSLPVPAEDAAPARAGSSPAFPAAAPAPRPHARAGRRPYTPRPVPEPYAAPADGPSVPADRRLVRGRGRRGQEIGPPEGSQ